MKFKHPIDTKSFIIGVFASLSAVVIWDLIKYNRKILEHKPKENELIFKKQICNFWTNRSILLCI